MYPIIDVPKEARESPEQVGSKEKFWYANRSFLFKFARDGTGEHWSEKIACELCSILGLPNAKYDFARWEGNIGTVSRQFVPDDGQLVLGNELLPRFVKGYDNAQRGRYGQHVVSRVIAALNNRASRYLPPVGTPAGFPLSEAADIFAGYVLLDAWIGNTDRHHENWGVIVMGPTQIHLAPTFDHASSLGRELTDEARQDRLATRDRQRTVSAYASRATSALYRNENDVRPLSTLEAFREIVRLCPKGAAFWVEKLRQVTEQNIDAIFGEVPETMMSGPARAFTKCLLRENQSRILVD